MLSVIQFESRIFAQNGQIWTCECLSHTIIADGSNQPYFEPPLAPGEFFRMSGQDSEKGFRLVPFESRELAAPQAGQSRILCEMVAKSLAFARESAVDLDAMVREGEVLYMSGTGLSHENIRAFNLFLRAAERGHSKAQEHLGSCYRFGKGVPQDDVESIKWYRKAAEQGNDRAQYELGDSYFKGDFVPRDECEAFKWFKKSAEQGNAKAQYKLATFYMLGQDSAGQGPVATNLLQADKWLRLAAKQNHQDAKKMVDLMQRVRFRLQKTTVGTSTSSNISL